MKSTHEGNRLRWWIEKQKIRIDKFLEKTGLKSYSNFYYYYDQETIKKSKLQKFCAALHVTLEQFNQPAFEATDLSEAESPAYAISKHHGLNLRTPGHKRY